MTRSHRRIHKLLQATFGLLSDRQVSTLPCHTCAPVHVSFGFYSAPRRNARIASAVLATAIPSVCPYVRPSVCLSHAGIVSKRRHVARCSLHCRIAKCVQFCRNQKIFHRDDPFPLKSWLQVTYPIVKAASFDTFCLVAPQP